MGRELFIDAASTSDAQRGRVLGKPVEGCWFCLSNPNADVELVASIGELLSGGVARGSWGCRLPLICWCLWCILCKVPPQAATISLGAKLRCL